jgi:hypothetical protein
MTTMVDMTEVREPGGNDVVNGTIRGARLRQWRGRQAARLAPGAVGATHGRRGTPVDRRLLSQRRLHAQQERDLEREDSARGPPRLDDGGTRTVTGDRIFLNVGTRVTIPNILGLLAAAPLTNVEASEFDHMPPHLIVLGGGYVGLECAQTYRRFGSRMTIIQQGPQLLGHEDRDVSDEMQRILSAEGWTPQGKLA